MYFIVYMKTIEVFLELICRQIPTHTILITKAVDGTKDVNIRLIKPMKKNLKHQTISVELCTVLISGALVLISNCRCKAWRAVDRTPNSLIILYHHHHHQPINAPTAGHALHIRRTGLNPPRGPSADWWVLTTANSAGTNGLMCLSKQMLEIINFWSPIQWLTNFA
jgi:hypothetical protein